MIRQAPLIQSGVATLRFSGEKIDRTVCCRNRLTPKVASSVSRGRPYRKRMMPRSMAIPVRPEITNAAGIAIASDQPRLSGMLTGENEGGAPLPKPLLEWFGARLAAAGKSDRDTFESRRAGVDFSARIAPCQHADEYLLVLERHSGSWDLDSVRQSLGLTFREAEILMWISRGKTNKEVGMAHPAFMVLDRFIGTMNCLKLFPVAIRRIAFDFAQIRLLDFGIAGIGGNVQDFIRCLHSGLPGLKGEPAGLLVRVETGQDIVNADIDIDAQIAGGFH